MVNALVFIAAAVAVFFIIYAVAHHWFPNMGRITATLSMVAATLLDQFSALPWGNILDDAKVKLLGFAMALCLAVLHAADAVKAAPPEGK